MYDGCPYTRESDAMRRSQFRWRTLTIHVGSSLRRRAELQFVIPPSQVSSHLSLIFLFPFQASAFTSTRSPGFRFTVPIFLLQTAFVRCASVVDWACTSPQGAPPIGLSQMLHKVSTFLAEASLMWGLIAANNVGKTKLTGSLGHHPNIR